jgi:hypothetical protein
MVVRAHNHIEHELREFVVSAAPRPDQVKFPEMNFDGTIRLALVLGPDANLKPASLNLYRDRNRVERFFNRIKQCRRMATRCDTLAANYLAFVQLASIRLWLRPVIDGSGG